MAEFTPDWIFNLMVLANAGVVVLTLALSQGTLQRAEPMASLPLPPVPEAPDPYEIAYLQSGTGSVARVVVFTLVERGYLRFMPPGHLPGSRVVQIERAPDAPDPRALCDLERAVLGWFSTPRKVRGLSIPLHDLSSSLEPCCLAYRKRLQSEGLLTSPWTYRAAVPKVWLAGSGAILVLGGVLLALARLGNIPGAFLLGVITGFGLILHSVMCHSDWCGWGIGRSTERGRAYLDQLQKAFAPPSGPPRRAHTIDGRPLPLLVALFGPRRALSGTAYESCVALLEALEPQTC